MMKYLLPGAVCALFALPATAEVTMQTCAADRDAMLEQAETNRIEMLEDLEDSLARVADTEAKAQLQDEIERTWAIEEEFRGIAAVAYRDCVKYVESGGS